MRCSHSKNQFDKRKQDWLVQKFGRRWFQGSSRRVNEQHHNRPCWRCPPSLHALKDWWDKSDVTWFLRGQTIDKFFQYKKLQSSLFILNNRKCTTFYIKDDNGKLWVKVIIVTFFNAEATVDVLTASNNDVNFAETQTVHFAWPLNRCFVFRE